jgi:hypothetical protein
MGLGSWLKLNMLCSTPQIEPCKYLVFLVVKKGVNNRRHKKAKPSYEMPDNLLTD